MACPKCGYERKPSDSAPDWQCPACGIAIAKYRAKAVEAQALTAGFKPGLSQLQLSFPARLASAAPDLALAGLFLWCWYSPVGLRPTLASELGVLMLMEFFVIHSGFFFLAATPDPDSGMTARVFGVLFVVLGFYLVVGGAFIFFHGGWWPALALGWLMLSQFLSVLVTRGPPDFAKKRQVFYWANGAGYYIVFGFVAVLLPMPQMGFGSRRGHGYIWDSWWSIPPQEVMAWGFLTFGALAVTKLLERPEWIEQHAQAQVEA